MIKKLKRKFADWVFKNMSFPNNCEHGNELAYLFKGNCPFCIAKPIEQLSNADYHEKYPIKYVATFGVFKIYLCEHHLNQLLNSIKNYEEYKED